MLEFSLSLPETLFQGNALTIPCFVNGDLTGYKITVNIFDQFGNSIDLATANVIDGSDDQVEVTNATDGEFSIYIPTGTTDDFHVRSFIEIDLEDASGNKTTAYYGVLNFTMISHGFGSSGC